MEATPPQSSLRAQVPEKWEGLNSQRFAGPESAPAASSASKDTGVRWRLTPQQTFASVTVAAIVALTLVFWLVLTAPWYGIRLDARPDSIGTVTWVDDAARQAGISPGDRVLAVGAPGGAPVPLRPLSLVSDMDQTANFPTFNSLLSHSEQLYEASRGPILIVQMADDRAIELKRRHRPISALSPWSWIMASSVIPLLVGAGVWSYRRSDQGCVYLFLAGASFAAMGLGNFLYAYRQPSIHPLQLEAAIYVNRFSALLFFFLHFAVFWVFPRRLGSNWVLLGGLVVTLLFFTNELTQTVSWPGNVFAFPLVLSMPPVAALIVIQWHLSRRNPVDRAALQLFVLVMMSGMVLVTGLYFLPAIVDAPPMLSLETAYAIGITSYLGLIAAVARYRLFQLGEWWLTAWLWLLGGGLIVALDLAITWLLNVTPAYVFGLSVVLVGWVYFPVRQWLWRKLFWDGRNPTDWLPRELLQAIVTSGSEAALHEHWQALLVKLFRPLNCKPREGPVQSPSIEREGLTLRVPHLSGVGGMELNYRSGGRRLFSPADVSLISSLIQMAGPAVNVQRARQLATERERERIMRDLHDDVGARLLTLSHRLVGTPDAEVVRSAIRSLRETIYSLNAPEGGDLPLAIADWRHEVGERLEGSDTEVCWQVDPLVGRIRLNSAQRFNLGHVLRESVSNVLRHSSPKKLFIALSGGEECLRLLVSSDSFSTDPAQWKMGTGMMSMRRRMQELGGHARWQLNDAGHCEAIFELPVVTGKTNSGQDFQPRDVHTLSLAE